MPYSFSEPSLERAKRARKVADGKVHAIRVQTAEDVKRIFQSKDDYVHTTQEDATRQDSFDPLTRLEQCFEEVSGRTQSYAASSARRP